MLPGSGNSDPGYQQDRNERGVMMNYSGGWMGGMWLWTVIGVLLVVLLVVVIVKQSRK